MVEKGREREIYGGASVVYVEPLPNRRPSSGGKEGRRREGEEGEWWPRSLTRVSKGEFIVALKSALVARKRRRGRINGTGGREEDFHPGGRGIEFRSCLARKGKISLTCLPTERRKFIFVLFLFSFKKERDVRILSTSPFSRGKRFERIIFIHT